REVRDGRVWQHEWTPEHFGLLPCKNEELKANGPQESARLIRDVLANKPGAGVRIVLANAAAALLAAERVKNLSEGVACAHDAIASGSAARVLDQLVACSQPKV